MDALLSCALARQAEIVRLIRALVECESPSDDAAAVGRCADLVAETVSPLARVRRHTPAGYGPHLECEFDLPGAAKDGQVLLLGHSDTVWPVGTLARMPCREAHDRLWGPGALDMKAGIAMAVFAARALRELDLPVRRRVVLQLNSDEEIGSPSSRSLTEEQARRSVAVLVLEPGSGLEGKLKTARKGVGHYSLVVRGKAAHAGVDFAAGASAILELARQIEKIAGFTQLARGVTVNTGVISGGSRSNVGAAEARAEIDVRVLRLKDASALDRKFRRLRPVDQRCAWELSGGLNRPPMERTAGGRRLFRLARKLAAELGVTLEESLSGGGSDGNFTAALGVPTLDGLGAVGEGMHAPEESVLIDRLADRTALLAKLLTTL
jgi:glutamate carboxypeptidase